MLFRENLAGDVEMYKHFLTIDVRTPIMTWTGWSYSSYYIYHIDPTIYKVPIYNVSLWMIECHENSIWIRCGIHWESKMCVPTWQNSNETKLSVLQETPLKRHRWLRHNRIMFYGRWRTNRNLFWLHSGQFSSSCGRLKCRESSTWDRRFWCQLSICWKQTPQ